MFCWMCKKMNPPRASNAAGKIVYSHPARGKSVYVNLTPRYACTNKCVFCDKLALEQLVDANLSLERAPKASEVLRELREMITRKTPWIVFCGIGEPTLYLNSLLEITRTVKKDFPRVRVRVDTNGHAKLMPQNKKRDVVGELKQAGVDAVSVSLNALTPADYKRVCRPQFKNAFAGVQEFVRECVNKGLKTRVSFVKGVRGLKMGRNEAVALARKLGVEKKNVLFREYISRKEFGGI